MENLRLILIRWNVAPLAVVGFLCFFTNKLVNMLENMACTDASGGVIYGALTVLIAAMAGILFKAYESLQKNRAPE